METILFYVAGVVSLGQFVCIMCLNTDCAAGADPGFQVRGGHLKNLRHRTWVITCDDCY
jgi:hypothetical protein